MMKKIKVLVVDDSALIRRLLVQILNAAPDIEVIDTAENPYVARDKIKKLNPDVLTLDIEMPKMDGLTFLNNLMRLRPMPVVMISSLTEQGADATLRAMQLGAVDFIAKPKIDSQHQLTDYSQAIIDKVRMAACANVTPLENKRVSSGACQPPAQPGSVSDKLIAIGASTGGTEALKVIVEKLPATTPPVIVTQHLPVAFSQSFAQHVDAVTDMQAHIAEDQQPLETGHIYIAPGDRHLAVFRQQGRYFCRLVDGERVNRHKPSVEVMFQSVAEQVGNKAIGVMLTGMGDDGARAMKQMRETGATNIVQDEESSVVWGMPGAAWKKGAADYVTPLEDISDQLLKLIWT